MASQVHFFDHSGDAYDAVQCDDTIKNGDILLIDGYHWHDDHTKREVTIVGLVDTWPMAVTDVHGHLHTPSATCKLSECLAVWTAEQIAAACDLALDLGLELHPLFAAYRVKF